MHYQEIHVDYRMLALFCKMETPSVTVNRVGRKIDPHQQVQVTPVGRHLAGYSPAKVIQVKDLAEQNVWVAFFIDPFEEINQPLRIPVERHQVHRPGIKIARQDPSVFR